jgi:hypothetical protein
MRNSLSVMIVEGNDYTPASIQVSNHVHIEDGIIASSNLFLSRVEAELLIEALKDKLGTLRYAKSL